MLKMKSSPPPNFSRNEISNLKSLLNEDSNLKEKESDSDLQSVFTKFLEEASNHAMNSNSPFQPIDSFENKTNANQEKDGMKKNKWRKYISFWQKFQNKFIKQDKPSKQTKEAPFEDKSHEARKLKRNSVYSPVTGVAFMLALNCFKHTKEEEEEIEVPYVKLEKLGYHTLRRDAFGPIYLVT